MDGIVLGLASGLGVGPGATLLRAGFDISLLYMTSFVCLST